MDYGLPVTTITLASQLYSLTSRENDEQKGTEIILQQAYSVTGKPQQPK